jgi:hypothetical protein
MTPHKIKNLAGELFGILVIGTIFFFWGTGVQLLFTDRPIPIMSVALAVALLFGSRKFLSNSWGKADIKDRIGFTIAMAAACLMTLPFVRGGLAYSTHQRIDWLGFSVSSLVISAIPVLGSGYFLGRGAKEPKTSDQSDRAAQ